MHIDEPLSITVLADQPLNITVLAGLVRQGCGTLHPKPNIPVALDGRVFVSCTNMKLPPHFKFSPFNAEKYNIRSDSGAPVDNGIHDAFEFVENSRGSTIQTSVWWPSAIWIVTECATEETTYQRYTCTVDVCGSFAFK